MPRRWVSSRSWHVALAVCLAAASEGNFSRGALAQPTTSAASTAQPAPVESAPKKSEDKAEPPLNLSSPRDTLRTFLLAIRENRTENAAACLDLSGLDSMAAEIRGPGYALRLKEILDRMWRIEPDQLPDDPQTASPYVLGNELTYLTGGDREDARKIELARGDDGLWRFSAHTVADIDELWRRWIDRPTLTGQSESAASDTYEMWLERQFPPSLRRVHFLIPDFQWLCLAVVIFLGLVADLTTRSVLHYVAHRWLKQAAVQPEEEAERKVWRPVGMLTQALVWYAGTRVIGLPPVALSILLVALKFFGVVAAVWTAFLLINLLTDYLMRKAAATATRFDDLLIPLIAKSLKVLAVTVGVLMTAETFNLPMTGILGGLGLGGMALALASKDAIANLFGSLTVLVDRPFEIGDWIITQGIEGSVETVGFRSTRIRTFYNSLITVPNSLLTTAIVDNMGRRRYRRVRTTLGVEYGTTPEQILAFCEGIRELIRRHPYTLKESYFVHFNDYGDSSLNILLNCFLECPDAYVEFRERERLLLDVMRLAASLGVSFAFPTRTLHLFQEEQASADPDVEKLVDPLDAGRRRAARIAGPPLSRVDRPGSVVFQGPTDLPDEPKPEGTA